MRKVAEGWGQADTNLRILAVTTQQTLRDPSAPQEHRKSVSFGEASMDLHSESDDLTWVPPSVNLKSSLKFP